MDIVDMNFVCVYLNKTCLLIWMKAIQQLYENQMNDVQNTFLMLGVNKFSPMPDICPVSQVSVTQPPSARQEEDNLPALVQGAQIYRLTNLQIYKFTNLQIYNNL